MRRSKSTCRIALLAIAASLLCFTALQAKKPENPGGGGGSEPNYEVVPLDNDGGAIVYSDAVDINEHGEIVGYVETVDQQSGYFPVLWDVVDSGNDVQTVLHVLASTGYHNGLALGINDRAEVVGHAVTDTALVGLYWPTPASDPLETPSLAGDGYASAQKINADGVICGYSRQIVINPDGSQTFTKTPVVWQAYLREDSSPALSNPVALPVPEGTRLRNVKAINDLDESGFLQVVGTLNSADGEEAAVVWIIAATDDGLMPAPNALVLDAPSEANGINNYGEVSGSRRVGNIWEGTLWSEGAARTLDTAKSISAAWAEDVNDSGVIVGGGRYWKAGRGVYHEIRAVMWPSSDANMIVLDKFLDRDSPFYELLDANAVSQGGDIIGRGWTGEYRTYVAIRR